VPSKETNQKPPGLISPFNKIFSENLKVAVHGDYPDLDINYPQVILSQGVLPNADEITVSMYGSDSHHPVGS
jgi:hypothetical protein